MVTRAAGRQASSLFARAGLAIAAAAMAIFLASPAMAAKAVPAKAAKPASGATTAALKPTPPTAPAAHPTQADMMRGFGVDCRQCHTCEAPSVTAPCLKQCPRSLKSSIQGAHTSSEAPSSMLLGKIADQYQAVRFNHRRHAAMSEMNAGCQTCHHFCPPGKIPACEVCHTSQANAANLRQPTLKGAYHRQCLACHREWSHDTDCNICHLPREGGQSISAAAGVANAGALKGTSSDAGSRSSRQDTASPPDDSGAAQAAAMANTDPTDIIGRSHPLITTPEKRVYHTPYQAGATVTFYHKEHIELFGLRCVDCHQKENCGFCHDLQKPAKLKKTMPEVHAICSSCHAQDKCAKCHDTVERPAFSHAQTGWSIGRFHAHLDCRACHPTGKRISRVNKDCNACHGGWNQENFRHAVTGLQLDETHIAADCSDCHASRRFQDAPVCTNCHDDGRDFRKTPPGKNIKVGTD